MIVLNAILSLEGSSDVLFVLHMYQALIVADKDPVLSGTKAMGSLENFIVNYSDWLYLI